MRGLRNECRQFMTGDTSEITELQQREFAYKQIGPGKVRAWLLRTDGAAVAYAILRPLGDRDWWMSCGVAENARGKGWGTLTVRLVTAMAHQLRPGAVRLEVFRTNWAARRVYANAGYVEDEREFRVKDGRTVETMIHR